MKNLGILLFASFALSFQAYAGIFKAHDIQNDKSLMIDESSISIREIKEEVNVVALSKRMKKHQISQAMIEPIRVFEATRATRMAPQLELEVGVAGALSEVEVIVDQVIGIGEKIWKIIEAGQPVVEVNTNTAGAVPSGITDWAQLENWRLPVTKSYQITYKNSYGIKVVDFTFRVIFMSGGSYQGKGQYIANAQIIPVALDVAWGYKFNANVQISQVYNMGSKEDPLAGMQLFLKWNTGTVLKSINKSEAFFIQGDGQLIRN